MKFWRREPLGVVCGRCGNQAKRGSLVLVYRFVEGNFEKVRCESCAGEPAPEDIPALVEREPSTIAPTAKVGRSRTFTGLAGMARDWKQLQSGGDR